MEMEARVDSTSDEDRLSVLPGVLIHAILSSAGADQRSVQEVEAPVWRSTPCLNINQREFFGPGWITFWKDCERFEDCHGYSAGPASWFNLGYISAVCT